jgi:hypothetical protein
MSRSVMTINPSNRVKSAYALVGHAVAQAARLRDGLRADSFSSGSEANWRAVKAKLAFRNGVRKTPLAARL